MKEFVYYTPQFIYSLPDPSIVTKEEADALTYAFVSFIRERTES